MAETFVCHNVEWFAGDVCLGCQAAQAEQDRIIKLLEAQKKIFASDKFAVGGGFLEMFAIDQAIALIKGENE